MGSSGNGGAATHRRPDESVHMTGAAGPVRDDDECLLVVPIAKYNILICILYILCFLSSSYIDDS
jgi:hypothetical protein